MARGGKRSIYLLLTFAFFSGIVGSIERLEALSHSPLHSAKSISFIATVKSDPLMSKTKVIGSRAHAASYTFLATLSRGKIDGKEYLLRIPVRIASSKSVHFLPGSRISGSGSIFSTSEKRVAALISARSTLHQISQSDPINRFAGAIRSSFRASALTIGGAGGALIPGLVLGDTSLEGSSFVTEMRRSGLTHLTAVSGENFAIIAAFILWLLQFVLKNLKWRLAITAMVLLAFIFLVRPSPSVMRASVMTAVLLIGRARGKHGSALPALGLAIGFLIMVDPFQSVDPGFALSVSATAGILLLSPRLQQFFSRFVKNEKVVELLSIPIAATIFCTPLTMALSGQLSLVALPANFLVSEVVAPITVIGFIAALISPMSIVISHALLLLCLPFASWIVFIAHSLGSLPLLSIPNGFPGAAIALIMITLVIRRMWKFVVLIVISAIALHFLGTSGWPGRSWLVVNCDVGQGDGAVVNLGNGDSVVIDAGPDSQQMNACLQRLKISRISLLVLTHFHADHVNGLAGVLAHRSIGRIWITNNPQPELEYRQTMELLRGRVLTVVHQGQRFQFHSATTSGSITVLWPREEVEKLPSLPGDGSGINNSSIALLMSLGSFSFYTSGDTEPPAQEEIARSGLIRSVDLMKISHHGSAYQYLPLLDLLHPKVALISVGSGNTYGHPAASTIAALNNRGIKVYRTDRDGAIAVDSRLRISTEKRHWWEISWG